MKRTLLPLLFSSVLFAECTVQQEQEANRLWKQSIHQESNLNQKLSTLNRAFDICPLNRIDIDRQIILAQGGQLSKEQIKELNNRNSQQDSIPQQHKDNNARKINELLGIRYDNTLRAVEEIGGAYRTDITFEVNRSNIYANNSTSTIQEIIDKIDQEVTKDKNALFVLEGGASSEGNPEYNRKLSQRRADALQEAILKQYPNYAHNIETRANGESELVCEGDFLPEEDSSGNFTCITKEDREASRRVTIRRER